MEQVIADHQRPAEPCLSGLERYQLVQKLEQDSGRSQWYATIRRRPEAGASGSSAGEASYEAKVRKRAETERLLCVFAPPKGDVEALAEAAASWARRISDQCLAMRHPHLMHTHDVSATDPLCPFVAFEFPEGGSLSRLLAQQEKLPPSECAHVVMGVGRAVGWLHGQGHAHGSIRSSEVYFSRSGVVLLKPAWGEPWGTPAESTAPTRADDVLAFADMTWRMLTGRSPGPSATRFPLPMLCPTATQPVVEALEAGLHEEPASRPTIHEIVLAVGGAWEPRTPYLLRSAYPDFASRVPAVQELPSGGSGRADGNLRGRIDRLRAGAARDRDGGRTVRIGAGPVRTSDPAAKAGWKAHRSHGRFPASKRSVVIAGAIALAAGGATAGARWWSDAHPGTGDGAMSAESASVAAEASGPTTAGPSQAGRTPVGSTPPEPAAVSPTPAVSNPTGPAVGPSPAGPTPVVSAAAGPAAGATDWEGIVKTLFASRDQALRHRDDGRVGLYAEAGELDRQDRALIEQLKATNTTWERLESLLTDLEVKDHEESRATVVARIRVTGWEPPGRDIGETGSGREEAGGSSQKIRIGLGRATGSWKITEVTPLDG